MNIRSVAVVIASVTLLAPAVPLAQSDSIRGGLVIMI